MRCPVLTNGLMQICIVIILLLKPSTLKQQLCRFTTLSLMLELEGGEYSDESDEEEDEE
jgi:hypothetical protein